MALKKDYSTGTKYLYAKVSTCNYSKHEQINFTIEIYEKDTEDEECNTLVNPRTHYLVEHATENDPFSIAALNIENNNIVSTCYDWIKENLELFNGWSDC